MANNWQAPNTLLEVEILSFLPLWLQQALGDKNAKVMLLSEGLSNDNYRLLCPQGDWVLRINREQSLWCDRHQELANWRFAAKAGLAPALIWHSDDKRFYLSRFVTQTHSWSSLMSPQTLIQERDYRTSLDEDRQINLLMDLLRPLSQLPIPEIALTPRVQWQDYFIRLGHIALGETPLQPASWHKAFKQLCGLNADIELWLTQLESCLVAHQYCHRDLNPSNLLLVGDKLQCIDFEYATASHPLFELASIIATHQLTPRQVSNLTEQYLAFNPNVNPFALKAMPAAMNCYWLCCAAWALLMAAQHATDSQQVYLGFFREYQQLITI